MEQLSFRDIADRTLSDNSTLWGGVSGLFGMFTVSEWCLLITAVVTILNFLKNWYIDYQKLKMEKEYHRARMSNEEVWQGLNKKA